MDIKVSSTIALISSLGLSFTSYMAYADSKELEKFETTKVYSPSSFLENIQKQPESLQSLKKESHNPDEYSSYAFIEGYVECEKPIYSEIDGKTPLVYRHAFKRDLFSNDSVSGSKAFSPTLTIETSRPSSPASFNLKDPLTDDICTVHRNLDVDATGAVERINQRAKTRKLRLIEKIFVQFGKFLDLVSSLFRNILPVRGVHIGWTETELGVTVGSALTVYGRVLYNSKMNSLRIQTPLHFLKEKATILKKLTERLGKWNLAFYMFLIPFTLSTSYLLRKILAQRRAAKKLQEEQEWDRVEKVKFANLEDEYKCVICLERPRNVILKPCMHFSLCRRCYNSLHKNVCPICKKPVVDTIAISFPAS